MIGNVHLLQSLDVARMEIGDTVNKSSQSSSVDLPLELFFVGDPGHLL